MAGPIPMSDILSALSFALDLPEGQPFGHAVRSCFIGMKTGERLGLSPRERTHLFYASLLKDAGCSSTAAHVYSLFGSNDLEIDRSLKAIDWTRLPRMAHFMAGRVSGEGSFRSLLSRHIRILVRGKKEPRRLWETRCDRGAAIAARMGFPAEVSAAVSALDEHWDGKGYPRGLRGEEIPLLSRIMCLAQTTAVFLTASDRKKTLKVLHGRSKKWFDPRVVAVASDLISEGAFDIVQSSEDIREEVMSLEPEEHRLTADPDRVDGIAVAFSEMIDAKSPYTGSHSSRVMQLAESIGERLGLSSEDRKTVRRAALLHDIGKLSVPNPILEKNGSLTPREWETVRLHPYYSERILARIATFEETAFLAAAHHERLDGSGYFRNLKGDQIPPGARILAVADSFEALTADRPYRQKLPGDDALKVLRDEVKRNRLAGDCVDALADVVLRGTRVA